MALIRGLLAGALLALIVIAAVVGFYLFVFAVILIRERIESRPRGNSPLPAERYDDSRRERSLWNPVRVPLDSAIAEIARRYAASDAAGRARMREAIDVNYFDELTTFAERAAVFALRERSMEHVRDGLSAIAMIDMARTNHYDTSIFKPVALLHDVATRIGADAAVLLRDAGALADESMGRFLTDFLDRPAEHKDLRKGSGLEAVQTPGGPGFIRRGTDAYEPTLDLLSAGLEMVDMLARDEYQPRDPQIATRLSSHWLRNGTLDPGAVTRALTTRAGVTIHAMLRPEVLSRHKEQSLDIFLVEVANEQDARALRDMFRQVRRRRLALLALAEGRLFCLVVANGRGNFGKLYETAERLARFQAPLSDILRRYACATPQP